MKCLMVFSHADDEVLMGAWALTRQDWTRKVLILCSDKNNPARQSYRRGEEALAAVCADVGVTEHRVLGDFFSEHYRLRTRGPGDGPLLSDWWNAARTAIQEMSAGCDAIVCDNPWGTYSHMDHLLAYRLIKQTPGLPSRLLWSDSWVRTSTWPIGDRATILARLLASGAVRPHHVPTTDPSDFARLKQHYVSRGCWTWSSAEPLDVTVYEEML